MSRLENHAMLRDAATDVLIYKYGSAAIEGIFLWKTDFLGNFSHEQLFSTT